MKKLPILSMSLIPLLLGGCYGAFITTDMAKNIYHGIKEKVEAEEYDPLVKRFTYIEKKTNMAQETYTKAVFDAEKYFYNSYTITAETKSDEEWVYRSDYDNIIHLIKYQRVDGKEKKKEIVDCTGEEEFLSKWKDAALNPVIDKLELNLQSALNRFEAIFNEVESTSALITASFMSSNENSLYVDARSTVNEGGKTYRRNAKVNIDDLYLVSYELEETTEDSTLSQLYSYDINKAFITYPSI